MKFAMSAWPEPPGGRSARRAVRLSVRAGAARPPAYCPWPWPALRISPRRRNVDAVNSERPIHPRFDDGMVLNLVSPGPPRHRTRTDKPVRCFTVADKRSGEILGYAWADDEDDAAAREPRQAAGSRAFSEGSVRHARLENARRRGLPPSRALEELLAHPEGNRGRALPDSLTDAPNPAAVEALPQDN